MNKKRLSIVFFFSIIIALVVITFQLKHNVQLRTIIEKKIQAQVERFGKCVYKAHLGTVTFLYPSVTLENVLLEDVAHEWSVTAQKVTLSTSWLSYIATGTFNCMLTINDVQLESNFHLGSFAIMNHFMPFFQNTSATNISSRSLYDLTTIIYSNTQVKMTDPIIQLSTSVETHGMYKKNRYTYEIDAHINNGQTIVKEIPLFEKTKGRLSYIYNSQLVYPKNHYVEIEGITYAAFANKDISRMSFNILCDDVKTIECKNNQVSILIKADTTDYKGNFACNVNYFKNLVPLQQEISGRIEGNFVADSQGDIEVSLHGDNIGIAQANLSHITAHVSKKDTTVTASYGILNEQEIKAEGKLSYDLTTHNASANITNTHSIALYYKDWQIIPNSLQSHLFCTPSSIKGNYSFALLHAPTDTVFNVQGIYTRNENEEFETQGTCNEYSFNGVIATSPIFLLKKLTCSNNNDEALATYTLTDTDKKTFEAELTYELFYNILDHFADYSLPGKGDLTIIGSISANTIAGTVSMHHALVRIPEMYNFLSDFTTHFSLQLHPFMLTCSDLHAQLHKGIVKSSSLIIGYDTMAHMHIPIQFHNCLLNKKNSLFANTSGFFLLSKKINTAASLDGTVIIEKGHMNENPFSSQGQSDVTSSLLPSVIFEDKALNLNLHIITKDPLVIKTPQLISQAVCEVAINNTLKEPHISGNLTLQGGTFEFPYKPLTISTARITFIPDRTNSNHQLEILAHANVKNYSVTVSVGGTVSDPHISLTSSPTLPEEQIISLLYTGSAHDSLNSVIPTFLTTNIQQRLLGAAQQNDTTKFSWFDTLKRIHILPSFADQSGRGGLRGRIEIDISDRLRATIQKNFSLSEDTRMEVEYDISDDIIFKAIKDERSDIGAEIEMRFKF